MADVFVVSYAYSSGEYKFPVAVASDVDKAQEAADGILTEDEETWSGDWRTTLPDLLYYRDVDGGFRYVIESFELDRY